jgi:hypothetical protein
MIHSGNYLTTDYDIPASHYAYKSHLQAELNVKLFGHQNNLIVNKLQFLDLLLTVGIHIYSSLALHTEVCCWLDHCPHPA